MHTQVKQICKKKITFAQIFDCIFCASSCSVQTGFFFSFLSIFLSPFIYFWILYECLMPLFLRNFFSLSHLYFCCVDYFGACSADLFIFGFPSFFWSTKYRCRRRKKGSYNNISETSFYFYLFKIKFLLNNCLCKMNDLWRRRRYDWLERHKNKFAYICFGGQNERDWDCWLELASLSMP